MARRQVVHVQQAHLGKAGCGCGCIIIVGALLGLAVMFGLLSIAAGHEITQAAFCF